MKRRDFLRKGVSALAVGGLGTAGLFMVHNRYFTRPALAGDFSTALPIPPLLENPDDSGQNAGFQLSVREGAKSFFPGETTRTLGYNGDFLGPTIKVRNGRRFRMQVENHLPDTTTVHWHGVHLPAQWDGGPRQPIAPGTTWSPDFRISQQAATLWYHPHAMGTTGEQVYRGLAGLFIVEDEVSDRLEIPKTYGVDDIPIILQDRRFYRNGEFAYVRNMHDVVNGVVGNTLLVNGALSPLLRVENDLIRLRVLNGSNSSVYRMSFGGHPFRMIASDGGFLERPVPMSSLILSAGERAELLLDLSTLDSNDLSLWIEQLGGGRFQAMKIRNLAAGRSRKLRVPEKLRPQERIPASEAVRTRRFVMETMGMGMMMGNRLSINGKKMDLGRIDERVALGSTEIWEITNRSAMMMRMPHSMHLHDVQFQILERNGRMPQEHERGRKDTVLLEPGETVRIISRFRDYKGIYMYHCHLLEHEDDGMMGQFEIV